MGRNNPLASVVPKDLYDRSNRRFGRRPVRTIRQVRHKGDTWRHVELVRLLSLEFDLRLHNPIRGGDGVCRSVYYRRGTRQIAALACDRDCHRSLEMRLDCHCGSIGPRRAGFDGCMCGVGWRIALKPLQHSTVWHSQAFPLRSNAGSGTPGSLQLSQPRAGLSCLIVGELNVISS